MMIHSVSYEAGQKDYSTPTLSDGYDWLDILKEGLMLKIDWPENYGAEMGSVGMIFQHPHNTLPSFTRDSFSKLESTMQENLFRILTNSCNSMVDSSLPDLDLQFDNINQVSELTNIKPLGSLFINHQLKLITNLL